MLAIPPPAKAGGTLARKHHGTAGHGFTSHVLPIWDAAEAGTNGRAPLEQESEDETRVQTQDGNGLLCLLVMESLGVMLQDEFQMLFLLELERKVRSIRPELAV